MPEIKRLLDLETALQRFRGAKEAVTMELAWFLTGLSYYGLAYPELSQLQPLAFETYRIMTRNQGERGFFGHQSTSRSLMGIVRGRRGSFADQGYPIYAMTRFGRA